MKFKDNLPIYLQIEDYINLQIVQGKLQAGEKLPSVRALALELTVNANTVQRALREMTAKGYIFTKRGEGNFVTTDEGRLEEMKSKLLKQELAAFVSRMEKLGVERENLTGLLASYLDDTREEWHEDFGD
ncbi:GntR family transcriptional regulator [Lactobacillus delbrueckii subsp. bulgaricus]|nr:GntR family transcriptional regulator [Lactobacillus delbrueckii subsp. bulgaricus]